MFIGKRGAGNVLVEGKDLSHPQLYSKLGCCDLWCCIVNVKLFCITLQ